VEQVAGALQAGRLSGPVTVVLEGAARAGAAEGVSQALELTVVHAPRDGDSAIVSLVGTLMAQNPALDAAVSVVTADRGLRDLVAAAGARVQGPSWLLDHL
jgi:riboflavin biosynthesis pyrimidine reductase